MTEKANKPAKPNVYGKIMESIFKRQFKSGSREVRFDREEIAQAAAKLKISLPKNLGDVVYSFRYRNPLPESIRRTADDGFEWIIEGGGIGKYLMRQVRRGRIVPRADLLPIKIPDSTPEIIAKYALGDEQALLARVRYNRLVDIFLGLTTYSLQNHLRTTVKGLGQIEIDEIYIGVDRTGTHFVVPVQAKSGSDSHSVVQTTQDLACCAAKFPDMVCRPVAAQFMEGNRIAMFELALDDGEVRIAQERHFRLVPSDEISSEDLKGYRTRGSS